MKLNFKAENLQDNGVVALSGVAGGMASGAINAITPGEYQTAGKIGHVVLGLIIASSVSGKTTSAKAGQGFGVGLAIRSGYDLITEQLRKVVPVDESKQDKFTDITMGALGMKSSMASNIPTHLLGEYNPTMNDNFDYAGSGSKVNVNMM